MAAVPAADAAAVQAKITDSSIWLQHRTKCLDPLNVEVFGFSHLLMVMLALADQCDLPTERPLPITDTDGLIWRIKEWLTWQNGVVGDVDLAKDYTLRTGKPLGRGTSEAKEEKYNAACYNATFSQVWDALPEPDLSWLTKLQLQGIYAQCKINKPNETLSFDETPNGLKADIVLKTQAVVLAATGIELPTVHEHVPWLEWCEAIGPTVDTEPFSLVKAYKKKFMPESDDKVDVAQKASARQRMALWVSSKSGTGLSTKNLAKLIVLSSIESKDRMGEVDQILMEYLKPGWRPGQKKNNYGVIMEVVTAEVLQRIMYTVNKAKDYNVCLNPLYIRQPSMRQADMCIPFRGAAENRRNVHARWGRVHVGLPEALNAIFAPALGEAHARFAETEIEIRAANEKKIEPWQANGFDILHAVNLDSKFGRWDSTEGSSREIMPSTGTLYGKLAILAKKFGMVPIGARQRSALEFGLYGDTTKWATLLTSLVTKRALAASSEAYDKLAAFTLPAARGGASAKPEAGGAAVELRPASSGPTLRF